MKATSQTKQFIKSRIALVALTALLLGACATQPESPEAAADARAKLTALQADSALAERARVEIRDAEQAVALAERPLPDSEQALADHRVYMAETLVAIAHANATAKLAEDNRSQLSDQRSDARLQARTREADKAHAAATKARSAQADIQERLDELQAKQTDRGMVVTLGDVLFDTGSAKLRSSANENLSRLASFLSQYPGHRVLIEGHTDNVGSEEYNLALSLRRAQSVRDYLTQRGISASRLSASGMGMKRSIASNKTAAGRQQNRRVEVVIENQAAQR